MHPEPRNKSEKPFACDVCDHRFKTTSIMRHHKQAVHGEKVFKCPQPECQYSSSSKSNLSSHLNGFHGTAGLFACNHPGCTFRTTWRYSFGKHKQQVHSDEKPFACDHTGCSFRTKVRSDLSKHKNAVHLNIRDKRCHVCEKGFPSKSHLRVHMKTHDKNGHEMEKCEDCSVNLKTKSWRKTKPAAGKSFHCDHQGCDYKSRWKSVLFSHRKQAHSLEKPFSCNYNGCSFRCKMEHDLMSHDKRVHQKIRTKKCHVCDKRFFSKSNLRVHMMSHQENDHDMGQCDKCVTYLKKDNKRSQAQTASHKRRAQRKGINSTPANKLNIEYHKKKVAGKNDNSVVFEEVQVVNEAADRLNDDLIDMHMNMQLLSSL